MRSTWKPLVLVLLISFLVSISSCSYLQENEDLTNQYNDVVQKYNTLLQQNNDLIQQYNSLLEQNNKYREEIKTTWDNYQKELQTALEGAIVPPYITMNGRKASYSFRNLDNQIESWSFDVEILEANTITGTFMRGVDISELNWLGLNSIAQRFINGNKYVILGGNFTFLDYRPYIVKESFQSPALNFYSRHNDDESRIKEVWNMVTQLCSYVGELKETPRLPLETLLFGGGDCEDLAILTASILKAMSSDWTVQLVYMDGDDPSSCNKVNHVSVFVDTGTYKTFVESTNKNIMNPYQSVDGFYVKIP
ncbi:MAG TPA: hypothetical protein VGA85_04145 [Dehalococcoidales bacterium]